MAQFGDETAHNVEQALFVRHHVEMSCGSCHGRFTENVLRERLKEAALGVG